MSQSDVWVETIESGLARQRKVWIIASEFDNMCIQKFDTHRNIIWYCLCKLPVVSISYYVMLDGYQHSGAVTFWKLSREQLEIF